MRIRITHEEYDGLLDRIYTLSPTAIRIVGGNVSRSHLRVSAQVNNERYESEIVRDIMNNRHPDYARSEATTEPMAVTPVARKAPAKGPTTVRLTKDVRMEAEIDDLRKELVRSMEARDTQAEALSLHRERIAGLSGQVAKLKEIIDRKSDTNAEEMGKAYLEIEALKALLKIYI